MRVNRFHCVQKFKVAMHENIESCMRVRGVELKPMNIWAPSCWLRLKSRYGFDERFIARLTNLGVPETIRRLLWKQHSRQHVMWQMIQSSQQTRAKNGARRILKTVTDQQRVLLDPAKSTRRTVITDSEAGAKEIIAQYLDGGETKRYTVQHLYAAVVVVRNACMTMEEWKSLP